MVIDFTSFSYCKIRMQKIKLQYLKLKLSFCIFRHKEMGMKSRLKSLEYIFFAIQSAQTLV